MRAHGRLGIRGQWPLRPTRRSWGRAFSPTTEEVHAQRNHEASWRRGRSGDHRRRRLRQRRWCRDCQDPCRQVGDTLSRIAPDNWAEVAAGSGIANPDLIFPVSDPARPDGARPSAGARGPRPGAGRGPEPGPEPAARARRGVERRQRHHLGPARPVRVGRELVDQHRQRLLRRPAVLAGQLDRGRRLGQPANASRAEQIRVAENLLDMQGWGVARLLEQARPALNH